MEGLMDDKLIIHIVINKFHGNKSLVNITLDYIKDKSNQEFRFYFGLSTG